MQEEHPSVPDYFHPTLSYFHYFGAGTQWAQKVVCPPCTTEQDCAKFQSPDLQLTCVNNECVPKK